MNYLSVTQIAKRWGMTPRRVQTLCNDFRIFSDKIFKCNYHRLISIFDKKLICLNFQCVGDSLDVFERYTSSITFDCTDICPVKITLLGKCFLRNAK